MLFLAWLAVDGLFCSRQYRRLLAGRDRFLAGPGVAALAGGRAAARGRPTCVLWLVGFFFWLAALQWLRLPHWATGFGWLALSFYFAFYLPVFVGVCAGGRPPARRAGDHGGAGGVDRPGTRPRPTCSPA